MRQGFFDRRDRRHHIGAGFPLNGQQNSRLAVEPGSERPVLGRLDRSPDVPDANRRSVAISHDRVLKALDRPQLVICVKRNGLLTAVQQPGRLIDGQVRDGGAKRFEIKVLGGELGRIDLDADRRILLAPDCHEADARDLREPLRHDRIGVVADRHDRQHFRGERDQEDRRVGRIGLAIGRGAQERGRQLPLRGVDRRLHILGRRIDGAAAVELQRDLGESRAAARSHLAQAGNLAELPFELGGDRRRHRVRVGPGYLGRYLDRRRIDLGQRGDGKQRVADDPQRHDRDHQKRGCDRPPDEFAGEVQGSIPALAGVGFATSEGCPATTRVPGVSRY